MDSAVGSEVEGAEGVSGTCPVTTVKVGAVAKGPSPYLLIATILNLEVYPPTNGGVLTSLNVPVVKFRPVQSADIPRSEYT